MHAILSKVFGRKKAEDKDARKAKRSSASGSLLEGKFEAVPPITSPSAAHFPENQPQTSPKGKDTSAGFVLFRPNSRPASSPLSPVQKRPADVPHLSLNLPVPKEQRSRALGVVFEADPDALALLDESVIGERRLSPLETLVLVRACSQVIVERGLESLGIMHPHWYSASPDVQRKLISLYIHSLAPNSPPTTLSPSSAAPDSAFQSELAYVRSPHDVAAVLRWGLRHLQLDGDAFGKDTAESAEWAWYTAFAGAERAAGFPPDAFSQTLVPELPPAHGELLFATLEIISSLAAHGEATGSSGSKLSKLLGLWLLTARRSAENDDWNAFYDRWERAGRILEHLFLSRIRDEAVDQRVPRRLTELVDRYPYNQGSITTDDGLLTRPRFSTRSYEAIFIHLESEYTGASKPRAHPLRIIAEALRSVSSPEDSDLTPVWDDIKKASLSSEGADSFPVFSNVFADETIRLLSLIPADTPDKNVSPTFALLTPTTRATPSRRRSFSLPDTPLISSQNGSSNGHGSPSSQGHAINVAKTPTITTGTGTAPTTASPETPTDWAQFSNLGFTATPGPRDLASTLWDTDVEVTSPPDVPLPLSRKSSRKRRSVDAHSRRSSVDNPATPTPPAPPPPPTSKVVALQRIRIDEAFVDFWSDALLDPIAASWGKFVLCQLKPLPALQAEAPTWLVIEQTFTRPAPPPPPPAPPAAEAEAEAAVRPRATSPRPSVKSEGSRISSTFSLPKRFSFFSHSQSEREREKSAGKKKAGKMPRVGEMGEIVTEEERGTSKTPEPESKVVEERGRSPVEGKKEAVVEGVEVAAAAAAVAAAGAGVAAVVVEQPKEEDEAETTAAVPPSATVDASTAEEPSVPAVSFEKAKPTNGAAQGDESAHVVPADINGDVLPAAPESVVLAGETPGPQVALQTSEPAAIAQAAADEALPVIVEEAPTTQDSPVEPPKEPEIEAAKTAEEPAVPVVKEVAAPVVEEAHTSQETITAESPAQDVAQPPVAESAVEKPTAAEPPVVKQPTLAAEESITVVGATPGPSVPPSFIEEPVQEAEPLVKVPTVAVDSQPIREAAPVVVEENPVSEPIAPVEEPIVTSEPALAVEEPPVVDEPAVKEAAPAAVDKPVAAEPAAPVEEPSVGPEPAAEEPPAAPVVAEETPAAKPVEEPTVLTEPAPVPAVSEKAPIKEPATVSEPALAVKEPPAAEKPSVQEPVAPAVEEPAHVVAVSEEPAAAEPAAPVQEPAQVVSIVQEEEQPAPEAKEQKSVAEPAAQKASVVEEPMPAPEPVIEEAPAAEEATPAAVEPVVEAPAEKEPTPAASGSVVAESPAVDEPTPGPVGNIEEAVLAVAEPTPANDTPEPALAVEQSVPEESAAEPVAEATPAETNGHAGTKEVENDVAAPDAPPSVKEPAAELAASPIPDVEEAKVPAVAEPASSAPADTQASTTVAEPELSKDESNAVPSEKLTTDSEA